MALAIGVAAAPDATSGAAPTGVGPVRRFMQWALAQRARQTPLPPGTVDKTLEHGGRTRRFYVHRPAAWNGTDRLPVVLLFHGGGGGARQALVSYGWPELADREQFLLVAPDGTGQVEGILLTWNVHFGFGDALRHHVDDGGFVTALLEALAREYPIDPDRLYATGISNGGILCHWLAARPDNRLAAIAPVVATLGGRRQDQKDWQVPPRPATPVSVLAINGALDRNVPLAGGLQERSWGEPVFMMSASQTMRFWVEANGCVEPPTVVEAPSRGYTAWRWTGGRAGTEVALFVLHRQGHAWPGTREAPRRVADPPDPDFPATELIWKFFRAHPRRAP
ncbi:MAG: hypothetical protein OZSIB_1852 [Candidatus Ozemobacter sibiricus]|jgi:polyhydroxybutyrate depolymerase|uniref:Peptidase S9 prolyl oligopeptidase catalytic domain-containing protein n=1 Tax=Candidatus Ozemobacter sibiricus TaxID=2268124 RepID=A0A367ZJ08_9BACT|nr:MAG: hypothetical protein OZSIB_1852 [Candidatus Ozemobacter sibiricus]